jgi:hypothetical protein
MDAGDAMVWLLAYVGVISLIAFSSGQILRRQSRKIFENRERIAKLEQKFQSAPNCFGSGDVLKPSGQAEHMCPKCPFLNACIHTSEKLWKP